MASNYKRLGNYIQQVDVRNTDLSVELLLGVSIEKKFIESHANTVGTDFSKYKIVKRGQFAYGPVTSRNGDKISIALLDEADACLISSSYTPFEIVKPDELNAEYLMMLFRNPEYDRFARYNSWGSAREVFSWEDFCDSELYIPDIEEQQKIVRQYKTITDRIEVLEKINEALENLLDISFRKIVNTEEGYSIYFENELDVIRGLSFKPTEILDHSVDSSVRIYRANNIVNNCIDNSDCIFLSSSRIKDEQYLNKGDILVAMSSGSQTAVGKIAVAYEDTKSSFGAFCGKIKIVGTHPGIITTYFKGQYFRNFLQQTLLGTTINNIKKEDLLSLKMSFTSEKDVIQFEKLYSKTFSILSNNYLQIENIKKISKNIVSNLG